MATADDADKNDDELTAGQRLAAAKAAKAARKAAKRGRSAEVVETKALKHAEAATTWAKQHRRKLIVAVVLVAVAVAGATGWSIYSEEKAQEASTVLWDAVETARAEIVAEGGASPDEDTQTYATIEARAERASERYEKVVAQYPSTPAAVWAHLGRGNALYELGEHGDARTAYQKALTEGGDDPIIAWRALEGIGFTYEAEEQWDVAIERFQELGSSAEGAWRDIADYHLARMYLAKNDEARAKETLRELVDRLRGEREGEPQLDYVLAQAELRLAALDPTLVPRAQPAFPGGGFGGGGEGGMGDMGDMDPEQLQRILEQLQKQGIGDGAGGGGGEGGGTE